MALKYTNMTKSKKTSKMHLKFNFRMEPKILRPKIKNMCVYCHMLKKIRVGRSEIIFFFLILFFITELMLDGI